VGETRTRCRSPVQPAEVLKVDRPIDVVQSQHAVAQQLRRIDRQDLVIAQRNARDETRRRSRAGGLRTDDFSALTVT